VVDFTTYSLFTLWLLLAAVGFVTGAEIAVGSGFSATNV
jgi:hypothetical protein